MNQQKIRFVLVFGPDDTAWLRLTGNDVPKFWDGHQVAPVVGDVLRIGGRQFEIQTRVWEHDGASPVLRLFLGDAHAQSDTAFG